MGCSEREGGRRIRVITTSYNSGFLLVAFGAGPRWFDDGHGTFRG